MAQSTDDFRKYALHMPQATEGCHMGHPDFRVNAKIFATLFTRDGVEWGMVKLKPDQQHRFITESPEIFQAIKGGWGQQGCTQVCLAAANQDSLREAILAAWCNIAPEKLLDGALYNRVDRARKPQQKTKKLIMKKVRGKRISKKRTG